MRKTILAAALLAICGAASAQQLNVDSNSNAGAVSNSESYSGSKSDSNSGNNTINPNQSVGVGFSQNFEASDVPTNTTQHFKTNTAVPLAAAVSFSSDYCGGTASGGASAAGISIGLAKPLMDGNCQAMRRSEKFGTAAANAYNAGQQDLAGKLIMMQIWEICNAGNDADVSMTSEACQTLGLVGEGNMPHEAEAHRQLPATPSPASEPTPKQEPQPRNPRGEVTQPSDDSRTAHAQKVIITGSNGASTTIDDDAKKAR